jgi:hypothetical protein
MDAVEITAFGQLPENQSGLGLLYLIGMLPVAVSRSHVRFPSLLEPGALPLDPKRNHRIEPNAQR